MYWAKLRGRIKAPVEGIHSNAANFKIFLQLGGCPDSLAHAWAFARSSPSLSQNPGFA